MRHRRIARCLFFALLQVLAVTAGYAADKIVYLQLLQPAPDAAAVDGVVAALRAFYPLDVRVLPAVAMPAAAFYPPRHRWRAERLLDWLAARLPADGAKVMGLTTADISTTKDAVKDWGVLGLGTLDGKSCVISTFRTLKGVSPQTARERLAKVAVHEAGHTFSLEHCPNAGCLMEDARGKVATVDGEADLCAACREKLLQRGVRVPSPAKLPWRPAR